ncbi:hypothetical protein [Micromonospora sp. NPDC049240]|uniref:hypothetical protein n=1 Tax=Micromonospora sp. NPDC049240 TaxID=3155151 RepID=UPI003402630C
MEYTENYDLTVRTVRLDLKDPAEPMSCGTDSQPRRFAPKKMQMEWRDGVLEIVALRGPRVLKDGTQSQTDDGVRLWGADQHEELLPDWAKEIVATYTSEQEVSA